MKILVLYHTVYGHINLLAKAREEFILFLVTNSFETARRSSKRGLAAGSPLKAFDPTILVLVPNIQ